MTETRALHQLRYLDALGVTLYSSRYDLPGAAPSVRVPPPVAVEAEVAPPPPAEREMPRIDVAPRAVESRPAAGVPRDTPTPPSVVSFSVAAVIAGPWLWLEELAEGVIGREQVSLVQAMARALGAGTERPRVAQFDWPVHRNRQLDLGEAAAGSALGSFVQRQVEDQSCEAIVLLGEGCRQRLGAASAFAATIETLGTRDMLADPALKRQVWKDLAPLRRGKG